MDLNDLYTELGRATAASSDFDEKEQSIRERHHQDRQRLEEECKQALADLENQRLQAANRVDVLQEAIRLVRQENLDPLIAKIKANESLEERKKENPWFQIKAKNDIFLSTYYDINSSLSPNIGPVLKKSV